MESKKIVSACLLAMFLFSTGCKEQDLSPVSLTVKGDLIHFKNENIQLIFDDLMYCKVEFELEGKKQSMNRSSRTGPDPLPPHFIMLDEIVYKNFKISSHEFQNIEDAEFGTGKRLSLYWSSSAIERTLVIADESSYVSYLEGCTAPSRDENQLHAAVVELIALDGAEIKYSTVQNWYPGDKEGKGGVYNFVTKRGICEKNAKISWTQVETGSAITWKYPSCILKGDNSIGEFYSIAVTNNFQQADTGTKMIHIGKNTKSTIISKGISAGKSQNSYRGLVQVNSRAKNARNFSQCDSLLMGNDCGAHTFPYIEVKNKTAQIEHEATTSKIGEDQIFYCNQRGIETEKAIALIVNGFSKEVLNKLPMEFAVEAQKLLEISLEGSVG